MGMIYCKGSGSMEKNNVCYKTVGKGKMAYYRKFVHMSKCFVKFYKFHENKQLSGINSLTLYLTIPTFNDPKKENF